MGCPLQRVQFHYKWLKPLFIYLQNDHYIGQFQIYPSVNEHKNLHFDNE